MQAKKPLAHGGLRAKQPANFNFQPRVRCDRTPRAGWAPVAGGLPLNFARLEASARGRAASPSANTVALSRERCPALNAFPKIRAMPTNPDVIRPMHIGLRDTFVLSAVSTVAVHTTADAMTTVNDRGGCLECLR
jgi:hypothetical protein